AAPRALTRADARGGRARRAPRRSAAVHPVRRGHLRLAWRAHARGAEEGVIRGELVAGGREQGHVGPRGAGGGAMLSRVADAIHWMSRYVERAENVARILDVSLQLMLDLPGPQGDPWHGVVAATGEEELFNTLYEKATRDAVVRFLMSDPKSPNSILS